MEKYDVLNVVGEGSYGLVMRCRHRESGQYVAIKKFLETEDDPTVRKMAIREIRMLKKLRHENLVNMLEVFRRKKRFFLVFEYLEHTVLEELESKVGGLGYVTSKKYIYQILRALDFIHSHNVIHRDIKPENVLVSRLGVIKLCDFGFARPYAENETFTDYVATRWYRSPELLVGDPRYGKEVDIWAIGCLYAEMMTGEPLFPGESDIDQLFQIIRILGKLCTRHQQLITQNSMFKGMKQEQNTNLYELFPDWNHDSLEFLTQCLKMNGNDRPDTGQLLKHELFIKNDFVQNFLSELRIKINQETQTNPLLKRLSLQYGSANNRRNSEERLKVNSTTIGIMTTTQQTETTTKTTITSTKSSSEALGKNCGTTTITAITASNGSGGGGSSVTSNAKERLSQLSLLSLNTHRPSYGTEEQLAPFRHYLTNAATLAAQAKQQHQQQQQQHQQQHQHQHQIKQININNLVFRDQRNSSNMKITARISSAKLQKSNLLDKFQSSSNQQLITTQLEAPPSPVPFQSLQPDINNSLLSSSSSLLNHQQYDLTMQGKRLSPVNSISISSNNTNNNSNNNSNNLFITGQYFSQKRSSNILGLQQVANQKGNKNYLQSSQIPLRSNFSKISRSNLLDIHNFLPITTTTTNTTNILTNSNINNSNYDSILTKDISPRVLPSTIYSSWLNNTTTTNLKISSIPQSTTTTTATTTTTTTPSSSLSSFHKINATILNSNNSKKILTDWKTIARDPGDFLLPNCPGIAQSSTSPYKGNKKKLSPMSKLSSFQEKISETTTSTTNTNAISNQHQHQHQHQQQQQQQPKITTSTQRNLSASSNQENEI